MSRNTRSRPTLRLLGLRGSSAAWRSNRTSAESTFGAGQNTLRPILPTLFAVPYQASFTLGVP